jgi:hypothetical protein
MTNFNYWFEFNLDTFLLVFIVLNIVNVVIQTVKTIVTVNGSPMSAAIINAITFAIYTVVVVFMNADGLGVFWKAVIIGVVNFIGVYVVKVIEIKNRKDKLWKVEATVLRGYTQSLHQALVEAEISHNYLENVGKWTLFNVYCETQVQSAKAKEILNKFNAKYFVSESKML